MNLRVILLLLLCIGVFVAGSRYWFGENTSLPGLTAPAQAENAATTPAKSEPPQAEPQKTSNAPKLTDRILGDPKAPVTILEYASLTCPHCARFHQETLPLLKKDFIDKGIAKLVFRPYPFDGVALQASMLAYCLPESRFYPFIEALFKSQNEWARSKEPMAEVKKTARLAGLDEAKIESCLDDKNSMSTAVLQFRLDAEKLYGINSTPAFIIGSEKIEGSRGYADFEKAIAAARK